MSVTNYYSVGGFLLGEETVGSGRTDYLTDALGSVTATVNQAGTVQNTYRYKPYGSQLAKTGVGSDPAFQWVGGYGYRQTNRTYSDVYVRARHYASPTGTWTTSDLAMVENNIEAYVYARSNPTFSVDPVGFSPFAAGRGGPKSSNDWDSRACQSVLKAAEQALLQCFNQDDITKDRLAEVLQCIAYGESDCNPNAEDSGGVGLYIIDCTHYLRCVPHSGPCWDCPGMAKQIGCSTMAAVDLMAAQIHHFSGNTLFSRICHYWGVLPCDQRPHGQNMKTAACLKGKGIDLSKTPVPNPLPTCIGCPGLY